MVRLAAFVLMAVFMFPLSVRAGDDMRWEDLRTRGCRASGPLNVRLFEQESLEKMELGPRVPPLPFGYKNAAWQRFKDLAHPDDEIFRVDYHSRPLVGWGG
jgi:hypothetical protein